MSIARVTALLAIAAIAAIAATHEIRGVLYRRENDRVSARVATLIGGEEVRGTRETTAFAEPDGLLNVLRGPAGWATEATYALDRPTSRPRVVKELTRDLAPGWRPCPVLSVGDPPVFVSREAEVGLTFPGPRRVTISVARVTSDAECPRG